MNKILLSSPNRPMWVIWGILIILFNQCKHKDPNPCDSQKPINADFKAYESIYYEYYEENLVAGNVFANNQDIYLKAQDTLAEDYTWKIGLDPREFKGRNLKIQFDETIVGDVNITLIVKGKPRVECFANDNGMDTLTQTIKFLKRSDFPFPYLGKFRGADVSNPDIIYDIEIGTMRSIDGYLYGGIRNFPNGCRALYPPAFQYYGIYWGTFNFYIDRTSSDSCGIFKGWGSMSDDKQTIKIEYEVDRNNKRVKDTFIGKRIL